MLLQPKTWMEALAIKVDSDLLEVLESVEPKPQDIGEGDE